eukprot:1120696-Pyramimonas_sp.AAC.1
MRGHIHAGGPRCRRGLRLETPSSSSEFCSARKLGLAHETPAPECTQNVASGRGLPPPWPARRLAIAGSSLQECLERSA